MMIVEQHSSAPLRPFLTPRQDRIEGRLTAAIASRGTRSAVREAVHQLVDHLRLQGVPPDRGCAMVLEVASRGVVSSNDAPPEDQRAGVDFRTPSDYLTLVSQWATTRYGCAD